jgi:hypothetical protein
MDAAFKVGQPLGRDLPKSQESAAGEYLENEDGDPRFRVHESPPETDRGTEAASANKLLSSSAVDRTGTSPWAR